MTQRLMVDLSSWNAAPNLLAHYRGGFRVLALKATEGTSYTWSGDAAYADEWHRLGGRVVHYHFARPGDPVTQADKFLAAVKPHLRRGDVLALDAEVSGVDRQFQAAFLARLRAKSPRLGLTKPRTLTYGPASFLRPFAANGSGLWVADYAPPADPVPGWRGWTAWQFTDRATDLPGIPGAVDCSHIRGFLLPVFRPSPPTLRVGARGPWVVKLQDLLNKHGARLKVDGVFGPATKAAVMTFKRAHGWRVDGAAGPRVWRWLQK